ncbi:MAG: hypothetical protein DMG40_18815 [Acidobacteria bacterium]|nr:MAG: hypothetical protein DMG40_18815 [Acidobacteriota bacterium]
MALSKKTRERPIYIFLLRRNFLTAHCFPREIYGDNGGNSFLAGTNRRIIGGELSFSRSKPEKE